MVAVRIPNATIIHCLSLRGHNSIIYSAYSLFISLAKIHRTLDIAKQTMMRFTISETDRTLTNTDLHVRFTIDNVHNKFSPINAAIIAAH
jgi:hypothetical protein